MAATQLKAKELQSTELQAKDVAPGEAQDAKLWLKRLFERTDRDVDGRLSREELRRPRMFERADADGYGALTLEEVEAFICERRKQGRRQGPSNADRPPTSVTPRSTAGSETPMTTR
jgi:hypothetical protein